MRQTIAVDVDDVLSATAAGFVAHINKLWKEQVTVDDYDEQWDKMWGITLEEAIKRAELLHTDIDYVRTYAHIEDALPVLTKLKENYKLVVLTSRRKVLKDHTLEWLEQYFPDIFSDIVFAGIWDDREEHAYVRLKRTKAEMCKAVGASYLIDDQLKHALGAADAGINALLFGSYKWNQTAATLPAMVQRVHTWKEVENYFNAKG